jgi:hypothetical protein
MHYRILAPDPSNFPLDFIFLYIRLIFKAESAISLQVPKSQKSAFKRNFKRPELSSKLTAHSSRREKKLNDPRSHRALAAPTQFKCLLNLDHRSPPGAEARAAAARRTGQHRPVHGETSFSSLAADFTVMRDLTADF